MDNPSKNTHDLLRFAHERIEASIEQVTPATDPHSDARFLRFLEGYAVLRDEVQLPVSQIAIELYAPLPGGLAAGGRFAQAGVKVPGLIETPWAGPCP
jgi:hypothetical protein